MYNFPWWDWEELLYLVKERSSCVFILQNNSHVQTLCILCQSSDLFIFLLYHVHIHIAHTLVCYNRISKVICGILTACTSITRSSNLSITFEWLLHLCMSQENTDCDSLLIINFVMSTLCWLVSWHLNVLTWWQNDIYNVETNYFSHLVYTLSSYFTSH